MQLNPVLARLRSISPLRLTLFGITFLEEMISGFPTIGLPLARDLVPMTYTQIGLLFSIGAFASMLLEPLCNILSDLGGKKYWVIGALIVLSSGFLLAGAARSFVWLLFAFVLIYPSNDTAVGLAQTALIDEQPQSSTRTMTRLTFISNLGDFLTPVVVTIITILALNWSALCLVAAALWLGMMCVVCFQRFPSSARSSTDARPRMITLLFSIRNAVRDPVLLRWALLALLPVMLDEVFRAFVLIYLEDGLHASEVTVEFLITLETLSGFLGLLILEVLLAKRLSSRRILTWSALLVFIGMAGLLLVHVLWIAGVMLCIAGAASICWYPLTRAEAYKRLPGNTGTVRALLSLSAPFAVILPSIVGFIAGRFGIVAGLSFLGLAPILLFLLTVREKGTENDQSGLYRIL
jgi:predicted MFS family arabinose efflux permease